MGKIESNKNVISEDLIFLDKEVNSQDEIIQLIVDNAQEKGYVSQKEILFKAVKNREREVPTAIGFSIAIPHGKTDAVRHPFIAFVRTKYEVRWTEKSEEMVRLVFLIGVPENSENNLHLKFISRLSKRLLDEEFRGRLLSQKNKIGVFEQLSSIEI
ncbi:PTS sugar transporter subunit IIA [Enterococcus saccharolyticus]|uniref:PTS sugar transporter n=1 Tax=Candidatus Enterococcus willemsii TaxID=1857215 RepID=A0ABQ6Z1F9_9ENTE|nr:MULTISPECIES: fructose PTS transporter subunit IIA [Enterococcus]KAF1304455.1 PTS sugar transporter [Enterococcus sp. CU12B]MCD5002172.1 PTS sugar transporter subunit IIA [Enterococcus saccharolyticus]